MLHLRLISGPLLVAFLVGCGWLDNWAVTKGVAPGTGVFALGILAITLACKELSYFLRMKGIAISTGQAVASGACGFSAMCIYAWHPSAGWVLAASTAFIFLGTALGHTRNKEPHQAMATCGASLLCFAYLGILPGFLIWIRVDNSMLTLASLIMLVKCCDIGAYFTGRALGKNKLILWLSPGKTIEGLIGGMCLSAIAANVFLLLNWLPAYDQTPMFVQHLTWSISGALLGFLGQGGDLLASLFKRDAQVKDSSQTIPGFGGILDVIDSPIAVAPIMLAMLHFIGCIFT